VNEIASYCSAVLCCRVSPKQKQEVVKLVKKNYTHQKTLAIGDGANDVNMITEAHIGVGIKGVEGQQAARSSDFAIGEFKHLRRLIFVYGREAYRRNSIMVLYMFFKNIMLVMPQFWYSLIFINSSGNFIYAEYLYEVVNILYTSMPIMLYAVLDRDCEYDTLEYRFQYYFPGPKKLFFNTMIFCQWVSFAFMESFILVVIW
jgi:phospholipid-transporting ATPase